MLEAREYTAAHWMSSQLCAVSLIRLFDDVMVMADNEAVKNNRLVLLAELRALFLNVADISKLAID